MKLTDLAPTQQAALRSLSVHGPHNRVRGGYAHPRRADDVHTVRCMNALARSGLAEFTELRGIAIITARGRALMVPIITPSSAAA